MKFAFSTLGCPDWTLGQIADAAQRTGFAVELRGIGDALRADEVSALWPEHRAATAQRLRASGAALCGIDCSARLAEPAARAEALTECAFARDAAAALGAQFIRVFGDRIVGAPDECTAYLADGLRAVCASAAGRGVSVLLETHGDFTDPALLRAVAVQVNRPEFGLIWDVEHTDTDDSARRAAFLDVLYPWIRHVHLKDRRGGALCRIGAGEVPLAAICRALTDRGYDGYFALEWEKRWHPELPEPDVALTDFARFAAQLD